MFFKRSATQTFAKVVDNLSSLGQNPMDILKLFVGKGFDKLQNLIGRGRFGVKNKSFKYNFNKKLKWRVRVQPCINFDCVMTQSMLANNKKIKKWVFLLKEKNSRIVIGVRLASQEEKRFYPKKVANLQIATSEFVRQMCIIPLFKNCRENFLN